MKKRVDLGPIKSALEGRNATSAEQTLGWLKDLVEEVEYLRCNDVRAEIESMDGNGVVGAVVTVHGKASKQLLGEIEEALARDADVPLKERSKTPRQVGPFDPKLKSLLVLLAEREGGMIRPSEFFDAEKLQAMGYVDMGAEVMLTAKGRRAIDPPFADKLLAVHRDVHQAWASLDATPERLLQIGAVDPWAESAMTAINQLGTGLKRVADLLGQFYAEVAEDERESEPVLSIEESPRRGEASSLVGVQIRDQATLMAALQVLGLKLMKFHRQLINGRDTAVAFVDPIDDPEAAIDLVKIERRLAERFAFGRGIVLCLRWWSEDSR